MAKVTREEWAKRIERWKDSGLTAAQYGAETGINAESLSWWKWRLANDAHEPEAEPHKRRRKKPDTAMMTFVEVPTTTTTTQRVALEVVLASGRQIRVPVGFDAPTFERLLAILERGA